MKAGAGGRTVGQAFQPPRWGANEVGHGRLEGLPHGLNREAGLLPFPPCRLVVTAYQRWRRRRGWTIATIGCVITGAVSGGG